MSEAQMLDWDAAEQAIVDAAKRWEALLAAVPDDLAHHTARNRIVGTLGALDDAAMYGARARTLVAQAQDRTGRNLE